MACNITSGIAQGDLCKDISGGVHTVYFGNFVSGVTLQETSEGIIDAQTGLTGSFYEYNPLKNSSFFVENVTSTIENGTSGWSQELTLSLNKMEAAKRNQIKILSQASLYAIVKIRGDKYFLLGEEQGLDLTGGNTQSGQAMSDLNGYLLTFTGEVSATVGSAKEVEASLISELTA